MIININNTERINYNNVVRESIVERNQGSVKIRFSLVDKSFIVLLMSLEEYNQFKIDTETPNLHEVINLTCTVVELLLD